MKATFGSDAKTRKETCHEKPGLHRSVGTPRALTVSVGVATTHSTGSDLDLTSLIARADAAMYEAKRLGRDRVVVGGDT